MTKGLLKRAAIAALSVCAASSASAQDTLLLFRSGKPFYRVPVQNVDSISFAYYVEPEEVVPQPNDTTGPQYVDLGLPSGTLWATYNLGATSPEEYGQPYSWGETRIKDEFTYDESAWHEVPFDSLLKLGVVGEDGTLEPKYDAARSVWGEEWQMPSQEQFEELFLCYSDWETQDGVPGRRFTGPNGKSMFLPATGHVRGLGSKEDVNGTGHYWTNKVEKENLGKSYTCLLNSTSELVASDNEVAIGRYIRPVMVKKGKPGKLTHTVTDSINGHAYVDLGLEGGLMWATCNLGTDDMFSTGKFYQWGATDTSKVYDRKSCKFSDMSIADLQMNGVIDANNILRPKYDVATVKLGDAWRTPTFEDLCSLFTLKRIYIIYKGMQYFKIEGGKGNCLFLPFAGSYVDTEYSVQSGWANGRYYGNCYYRSAKAMIPNQDNGIYPFYFNSLNYGFGIVNLSYERGLPVRPVTKLK